MQPKIMSSDFGVKMSLTKQYNQAFSDNCLLEPESWFEDETPPEQLELLDNLVVSTEVAEQMLLCGETCWNHLAWWKDVYRTLRKWAHDGHLIKVRLIAQWLTQTLPEHPMDSNCPIILAQLANGDFCQVFDGMISHWPHKPEFYRKRLMLDAAELAVDVEMNLRADIKARLILRSGIG